VDRQVAARRQLAEDRRMILDRMRGQDAEAHAQLTVRDRVRSSAVARSRAELRAE